MALKVDGQEVSTSHRSRMGIRGPCRYDDMAGNVWQWVEDCYSDSYASTPRNGTALISSNCESRVLRGGSWSINPRYLRSAYRSGVRPDFRDFNLGFRIAREP
jgi:formylglycine-generating enzyme required for sulfatase activity